MRKTSECGEHRSTENIGVYYAGQKTWLQLMCCTLAAGTGCLLFWNGRVKEVRGAEMRKCGKAEMQKCRKAESEMMLHWRTRIKDNKAELLKVLLDFMQELGFSEDSPPKGLIHVGGDGLNYERMVLLKWYMQFHNTPFQRLEWLEPFLEMWHTFWTDLSRIYEAHWDSLLSLDPSSIGHSANKVKCKAPANLKKVDYYPYSKLAYQVLDARIFDCWR